MLFACLSTAGNGGCHQVSGLGLLAILLLYSITSLLLAMSPKYYFLHW